MSLATTNASLAFAPVYTSACWNWGCRDGALSQFSSKKYLLWSQSKRPRRHQAFVRAVASPPSNPGNVSPGEPIGDVGIPVDEPAAAGVEDPVDSSAGVQNLIDQTRHFVNTAFDTIVWPLVGSCSLVRDNWERKGGHFVLRPPAGFKAKAVLHFIGGAVVGASPHIAYSSLLSRLAKRGFVVVATPYDLSLDYLQTVGDIVERFEGIEVDLALEFGAIPVIGVGHSAGALFHAISASLFDDISPKAGLVLISYNNKPVNSAIPAFEQLVTPIAKQLVDAEERLPENLREFLDDLPETLDAAVEGSLLTPSKVKESVLPLSQDARRAFDQFSPLLRELAGKPRDKSAEATTEVPSTEFYPPPADIRSAITNMYGVEQTLVVKFRSDSIDESEVVMDCVMNRGGGREVSLMEIGGNHLTPLIQDLPDPAPGPGPTGEPGPGGPDLGVFGTLASGLRDAVSAIQTKELYVMEALIAEWVEAGLLNETL